MIYKANCKINIGLNILSKRHDGFHELSTIMYPVKGLADLVEVVHSDSLKFTSSGLVIDCAPEDNLCLKAYHIIKSEYNDIPPVHIHLHKIVPFGAGLGGGSSDATFTLIAINELLGLSITKEKMSEMAAKLGSDTSFFVNNTPQLCSSRGEVMQSIDVDLDGYYLTIVKPNYSISTATAFAGITPQLPEFNLISLPTIDLSSWKDLVVNDFEASLFPKFQDLQNIKDELYANGAIYASLSGSGSALFAISKEPIGAEMLSFGLFFKSYKI